MAGENANQTGADPPKSVHANGQRDALAARGVTDVGEFFERIASEAKREPERIIEILEREGLLG
jgi:hypothetical protein